MPVISVGRDKLFKSLGKEYSKPGHVLTCNSACAFSKLMTPIQTARRPRVGEIADRFGCPY